REENTTDLVLGLHFKKGSSDSFLGNMAQGILSKSNITTFIYNPQQPIATIKRHIVVIPEQAEYESGFSFWLSKIWNIGINTGAKMVFYASRQTMDLIRNIHSKHPIESDFKVFTNWGNLPSVLDDLGKDDNIVIVLSRKDHISYRDSMDEIPNYLNRYQQKRNFLLVYPSQSEFMADGQVDLTNPSLLKAIKKLDVIGKTIAGIFQKEEN